MKNSNVPNLWLKVTLNVFFFQDNSWVFTISYGFLLNFLLDTFKALKKLFFPTPFWGLDWFENLGCSSCGLENVRIRLLYDHTNSQKKSGYELFSPIVPLHLLGWHTERSSDLQPKYAGSAQLRRHTFGVKLSSGLSTVARRSRVCHETCIFKYVTKCQYCP